ncbi:MAG: 4a-hydroxytetrahydrobiopterin dehydratase [Cohaesibacter sp.]|jgi:4a-hydroxytetrahydrobiopterin dehydratase|nr:4a-hydroxytetrahydrobiopterin dehydratase [Cohaesibacter sp.]
MTDTNILDQQDCVPCSGKESGIKPLAPKRAADLLHHLHEDWSLSEDSSSIVREIKVKGFAKAVYLANMAAYIGDQDGHHPDIQFGWGYCRILYTTHAIGGLSENDFICARHLDKAVG